MQDFVELHAIFTGIVQGVGFRYTISRLAASHKVSGTVRNLGDGSVELVAQGKKNHVEAFLELLKKNPGSARIEDIQLAYHQPTRMFSDFKIVK